MSSQMNKSLGILLLSVLIILVFLQFMPFLIGPFSVFPQLIKHTSFDFGPEQWGPRHFGFLWMRLFPLLLLILWIVVIVWVYRDAEQHGMNGLLWALLVFVGNIIGLIVYLIVRAGAFSPSVSLSSTKQILCPNCGKMVPGDFAYCPHCGASLHARCPSCGKDVQTDWKVCPYCGTNIH